LRIFFFFFFSGRLMNLHKRFPLPLLWTGVFILQKHHKHTSSNPFPEVFSSLRYLGLFGDVPFPPCFPFKRVLVNPIIPPIIRVYPNHLFFFYPKFHAPQCRYPQPDSLLLTSFPCLLVFINHFCSYMAPQSSSRLTNTLVTLSPPPLKFFSAGRCHVVCVF